jgi:hypothetical protein
MAKGAVVVVVMAVLLVMGELAAQEVLWCAGHEATAFL